VSWLPRPFEGASLPFHHTRNDQWRGTKIGQPAAGFTWRRSWKEQGISENLSTGNQRSLEVRLPGRPRSIAEARHRVGAFVRGRGAKSADIEIAVTEAVANAVAHGFRDAREGTIVLRVEELEPETLAVTVSDDGVGIRPRLGHRGLGFGLALIARLSAGVEIRALPRGTELRMRFELRPA
jgi:anti-sigma regulatory factor (Ser/Thr protein kinase)